MVLTLRLVVQARCSSSTKFQDAWSSMDPVVEHERNELLMRIRMPDCFDGYSKSVDLRDVNIQINQLTPSDFEKMVSYMYGTREIDQDVPKNLYCLSTYANVSLRRALKDTVESVKNIMKDQGKLEHYPALNSSGRESLSRWLKRIHRQAGR